MSWNKSLPGDNQKIRELGTVIRPNWEAIEEGDDVGVANMLQMRSVQLDNRTGLAANNDPQTNVGTHYIYSKDDAGAVVTQEAFMKDSLANLIQLTNDGGLGGKDVRLNFNDLTNDDGTTVYDEKNLVGYWAIVSSAGVMVAQSGGLTSARNSLGNYTIGFVAPQSSVNYGVVSTAEQAPGNLAVCHYSLKTANNFVITIANQSTPPTKVDKPFTVSIFGGRPT